MKDIQEPNNRENNEEKKQALVIAKGLRKNQVFSIILEFYVKTLHINLSLN